MVYYKRYVHTNICIYIYIYRVFIPKRTISKYRRIAELTALYVWDSHYPCSQPTWAAYMSVADTSVSFSILALYHLV